MSDNHAALIAAAGRLHRRDGESDFCVHCRNHWPCLTDDLARSLAKSDVGAVAELVKDARRQVDQWGKTLRARKQYGIRLAWREFQRIVTSCFDLAEALNDASAALEEIRELTNLALPSEQTGPDWERCIRIPVARMMKIDAVLAGVLGEPSMIDAPKPELHAKAGIPTGPGTIARELTDPGNHGKPLVQNPDGTYRTVGRAIQRVPKSADLDDRRSGQQ